MEGNVSKFEMWASREAIVILGLITIAWGCFFFKLDQSSVQLVNSIASGFLGYIAGGAVEKSK
jgi:hypothetical protein